MFIITRKITSRRNLYLISAVPAPIDREELSYAVYTRSTREIAITHSGHTSRFTKNPALTIADQIQLILAHSA